MAAIDGKIFEFITDQTEIKLKYKTLMDKLSSSCMSSRSECTRRSFNITGCKYWQFVYNLFFIYNRYTRGKFIQNILDNKDSEVHKDSNLDNYLKDICFIYILIARIECINNQELINALLEYKSINLYEQIKKFYQITFNNTILPWDEGMYVVKINTFQEILSKIDTDILYQNFNLCIYIVDPNWYDIDKRFYESHFFTIIYYNTKYYITSAFGSGIIRVPQYTTEMDANDIQQFNELCINDKSNLHKFFTKFFLRGSVPFRHDEDDIEEDKSLKHKWIDGNSQEVINSYMRKDINIGLIPDYDNLIENVNNFIQDNKILVHEYLLQQQGGRKTKRKQKSKRKQKNRKSKRKQKNRKSKRKQKNRKSKQKQKNRRTKK